MTERRISILIFFLLLPLMLRGGLFVPDVFAQDAELSIDSTRQDVGEVVDSGADAFLRLQQELHKKKLVWPPYVKVDDFENMLFTPWQRTLINDAVARFEAGSPPEDIVKGRNGSAIPDADGVIRGPEGAVMEVDELGEISDIGDVAEKERVNPGIRELQLGGIIYSTNDDWIIWLNGLRVTPDAWPDRVIDLDVFSEYIDVIWFDEYTSLVYPIRLRPHQRFNLDRRIYLPGTTGNQ